MSIIDAINPISIVQNIVGAIAGVASAVLQPQSMAYALQAGGLPGSDPMSSDSADEQAVAGTVGDLYTQMMNFG